MRHKERIPLVGIGILDFLLKYKFDSVSCIRKTTFPDLLYLMDKLKIIRYNNW